MKESQFIRENSERWKPLEDTIRSLKKLGRSKKLHKDLGDDYIRVTDDLGYAQTFYKRRSVRVYLNKLTADIYRIIRLNREKSANPFREFWMREVPSIIYHGRKYFFISFVVFALSMIIGAFSLEQDTEFAADILGNNYVDMTEENIANGDPMGVYKSKDSEQMFLQIAVNNLRVVVLSFIVGLFFGLGTLSILIGNGIMLGVFQYFFYQKGLLFTSFLTIWQHGTIEISCIIIGGGAGLMLGSGYLFPGNYSRLLSLRLQFYRGMKIILAIAPLIVIAAWIESYITRHDDMSVILRGLFIFINATLILGYFFILPWRVGRSLKRVENRPSNDSIAIVPTIDEKEILNLGEIFQLAVRHIPFWLTRLQWLPLLGGAFAVAYLILFTEEGVASMRGMTGSSLVVYDFVSGVFSSFDHLLLIFSYFNGSFGMGLSIPLVALLMVIQLVQCRQSIPKISLGKLLITGVVNGALLYALFFLTSLSGWFYLILFISILWIHMSVAASFKFEINPVTAVFRSFRYLSVHVGKVLGWSILMLFSSLLLTILFQSSILGMIFYFLDTIVPHNAWNSRIFLANLSAGITISSFFFIWAICQAGAAHLLDTLHEQLASEHLRNKIASIQPRKKRYGIDEAI